MSPDTGRHAARNSQTVMKRLLISVSLFGLSLAHAQAPFNDDQMQTAIELRDAAAKSNLAYQITESLTTEVGPRMGGTEGDEKAVAWGIAKLNELGYDRVYTEPVQFPVWHRGDADAEVTAPFRQPLVITALGGSPSTPADGIEAEVVHFATVEALENADDDSLGGRIAFISNRMERAQNGSGYGPAVRARSLGPQLARDKGASALLIRSIGTSNHRIAHTGLMRVSEENPGVPAAALSNPDADLLERLLDRDLPVTIGFRTSSHWGEQYTSHNVIGEITGSTKADEYVLIGCHLDSWDLGTGAFDDGAGCGITMAAAYLISELDHRPARTIRVVLFANEEQGLHGARAYLEAHRDTLEKHAIGSESDFGAGRIYRFSSRVDPSAFGAIDQITQVMAPLGIVRGDNLASGGADMTPMRQAGMAVASLHQDGMDYFDLHHTANDTLALIEPEALQQNTAAWVAFTYLTAQYKGSFGSKLTEEQAND